MSLFMWDCTTFFICLSGSYPRAVEKAGKAVGTERLDFKQTADGLNCPCFCSLCDPQQEGFRLNNMETTTKGQAGTIRTHSSSLNNLHLPQCAALLILQVSRLWQTGTVASNGHVSNWEEK